MNARVDALELAFRAAPIDDESGLPRFEPGETARGVIRVTGRHQQPTRGIVLVAVCLVEGRHATDRRTIAERRVHVEPIAPGTGLDIPFDYTLPFSPWSYAGQLMRISWALEARLDVTRSADIVVTVPFILAPAPVGQLDPYPGPATLKTEGPPAG